MTTVTTTKNIAICSAIAVLCAGAAYGVWNWVIPARYVDSIPDIGAPFDVEQYGVIAIAPDRNAFDLYLQANELLVPLPEDSGQELESFAEGNGSEPAELTPALSTWLTENQPALKVWLAGTERSEAVYYQPRDLNVHTPLPVTQQLPTVCRSTKNDGRSDDRKRVVRIDCRGNRGRPGCPIPAV